MSLTNQELQVCGRCLVDAKEMQQAASAGTCRFCQQKFDTYKWVTDRELSTIVCCSCANEHNACQSCVKDLTHNISLPLRERCLEIIKEEGGDLENKELVQKILSKLKPLEPDFVRPSSKKSLKQVLKEFPVFSSQLSDQPPDCKSICIFGIEADLLPQTLKSAFNVPVKIDMCTRGRYAFVEFTEKVPELQSPMIIDHRKVYLVWADRVKVPVHAQSKIGSLVRMLLKQAAIRWAENQNTPQEVAE